MIKVSVLDEQIISVSSEVVGVDVDVGSTAVILHDEEIYQGDCHVTPCTDKLILPTKNKLVLDDVVVNEIPFYEVSNTKGNTAIIGGNLDGN